MFRQRSAIFRESTKTEGHKHNNTPLQVLIDLSTLIYQNINIPEYIKLTRFCYTLITNLTHFSGHYLRNRSNLDIGVLGYIGIL